MNDRPVRYPRCIIIAGPNGSGKTTFAREFLPREGGVVHFVNADLIASGLSPLRPELAARQAGRLLLLELSRLAHICICCGTGRPEGTRSGSYFSRYQHPNLRYNVSLPELYKVAMMFLAVM